MMPEPTGCLCFMQILVKHVTIGEDGIEMEFYSESIKSIQEAYHAQSS